MKPSKELGILSAYWDGPGVSRSSESAVPNIELLKRLSNLEIRLHHARFRAVIFPGEEEFCITPLEAQSTGRPVMVPERGNTLDTDILD